MKLYPLLFVLLLGCDTSTEPSAGLEAGPGSPECRRAIHTILHPGERAYDPKFKKYQRYVLSRCVPDGEGEEGNIRELIELYDLTEAEARWLRQSKT